METTVTDNVIVLCVFAAVLIAAFLFAIACSIRMLTFRVLSRNMIVVANLFFTVQAIMIIVLTIMVFYILDFGPMVLAIIAAVVLLLQGLCGIISSQTGWPICILAYIVLAALSALVMIGDCVTMLAWGSDQVWTKVAELPDGDGYADAPGFSARVARLPLADTSMPIEDMATYAEGIYKLVGFSAIVAGVVLIGVSIVSIFVCIEANKRHKQEVEFKKREELRKEMGLPTMMLDLPGFAEEYGTAGNENAHEKAIELEDMKKKQQQTHPHLRHRRHDWEDLLAANSMMI
jgi:hypothetical protein